ncbi:hypothetical protein ACIA5C_43035 [Actinoplanes sp. NPDC051343]|uniref:hypothetical protein n=1 Tax=Actinoplanes sp. NPDC051343 TaxID=3363906 RepID=UPI0037A2A147
MRGGLDDALEKLARRDELRRRAAHEATGTPAAVNELVEAIAAVVGRHPRLGVTVGVEGEGDPMVLRFYYEDGQVQVTAENSVATQPRADFDVEVGEPVEEFPPAYPGTETPRMSQDDQDRFGPAYGYEQPAYEQRSYHQPAYYAEPETTEGHFGGFEQPAADYGTADSAEPTDLGARMRDLGMASSHDSGAEFPPHPLAPTPPPTIPPQTTRRIDPEQYRAPFEPAADQRAGVTERLVPPPPVEPRGMPTPLPEPIPLQVERPEETEMAARRLAALLRDDPTLLSQRPD